VTFDPNGGTYAASQAELLSQTITKGTAVPTAKIPTVTRDGYDFNGWKSTAGAVPTQKLDKDTTFKAQWTENLPDLTREEYNDLTGNVIEIHEYVRTLLRAADQTAQKFVSAAQEGKVHVEAEAYVDIITKAEKDGKEEETHIQLIVRVKANFDKTDDRKANNTNTALIEVLFSDDGTAPSTYFSIFTQDSVLYVGEKLSSGNTLTWRKFSQLAGSTPKQDVSTVVYLFQQISTVFGVDTFGSGTEFLEDGKYQIDSIVSGMLPDVLNLISSISTQGVLAITIKSDNPYYNDLGPMSNVLEENDRVVPKDRWEGNHKLLLDGVKIPTLLNNLPPELDIKTLFIDTLDDGLKGILNQVVQVLFNMQLDQLLDPKTDASKIPGFEPTELSVDISIAADGVKGVGVFYNNPKANTAFGISIPKITFKAGIRDITITKELAAIPAPAGARSADETALVLTAAVNVPGKDIKADITVVVNPAIKVNLEEKTENGKKTTVAKVDFAAVNAQAKVTIVSGGQTYTCKGIFEDGWFYFDISGAVGAVGLLTDKPTVYKFRCDLNEIIHESGLVGGPIPVASGAEGDKEIRDYTSLLEVAVDFIKGIVDNGFPSDIMDGIQEIVNIVAMGGTKAPFGEYFSVINLIKDLADNVINYQIYDKDGKLIDTATGKPVGNANAGTKQSINASLKLGDLANFVFAAINPDMILERYADDESDFGKLMVDIANGIADITTTPFGSIIEIIYNNVLIGNKYFENKTSDPSTWDYDYTAEAEWDAAIEAEVRAQIYRLILEFAGVNLSTKGDEAAVEAYIKGLTIKLEAFFNTNGLSLALAIVDNTEALIGSVSIKAELTGTLPTWANNANFFSNADKALAIDLGARDVDGEWTEEADANQDALIDLLKDILQAYQDRIA